MSDGIVVSDEVKVERYETYGLDTVELGLPECFTWGAWSRLTGRDWQEWASRPTVAWFAETRGEAEEVRDLLLGAMATRDMTGFWQEVREEHNREMQARFGKAVS